MTKTVLITGATGQIGRHSAQAFSRAGWDVRRFRRGDDMVAAARGADVIVNGMNPKNYHDWAGQLPRITDQHIAAARASGATIILPGNVYNLGDRCPGSWDADAPHRATTRKGRIRAELEKSYRDAGVQTIVLRAGNFIDPDGDADVMQMMVTRALAKGRMGLAGDPSARQAWCYLPDWASAAVSLAERRDTLDRFEVVPFAGYTLTADQLRDRIARITGTQPRYSRFPWWAMTLFSPVWELAREMAEMRYLYSLDHALSGAKLNRLVPEYRDTPIDVALTRKLAFQGIASASPNGAAIAPASA